MAPPSEKTQLDFLAYIQRLLDEGDFSATYKYALLMALADLAIEQGDDSGDSLELEIRDIASMFVRYYWRQTRPYINGVLQGELLQNNGQQASIINLIRDTAANNISSTDAPYLIVRSDAPLVRKVAGRVKSMPLWRLQVLGGRHENVLYPETRGESSIVLNPGIAFCFRRFHGLVTRLAQDAWIRFVRNSPANQALIGGSVDLGAFLFGSERANLELHRPLLTDLQRGTCFYCPSAVRYGEVDHFIPWSRYPHDLGHNFVLACEPCNRSKRDMLANHRFRERWQRRNDDHGVEMSVWFKSKQLPHDLDGIRAVADWAYAQAQATGAQLWSVS